MNQPLSGMPATVEAKDIARDVARVYAITLTDLPRALVIDAAAIWSARSDDALANAVLKKMSLLAEQHAMHMIVRGVEPSQADALERAIPRAHLTLERHSEGVDVPRQLPEQAKSAGACVAVLATSDTFIPDGCTAFYAGEGDAPKGTYPTYLKGAHATDFILALYGTALVQEQAGIAFRNISEGKSIPREAVASPETLIGVVRSVQRPAAAPSASSPRGRVLLPDAAALRALAARALSRLIPNVLPNGAVVGSPAQGKDPGQPNYWFYWQRDGAVTMGHLIEWQRRPPLGLDTGALGQMIDRYPNFVARTQSKGHLGTSRYTVEGESIAGFGNPQLDGPPLSAMALARMEHPSPQVWELMRGYLDFLLTHEGRGPSMDAWEFIYGWHFNAAFLKRRALLIGAQVATRLGHADDARRYATEARRVAAGLEQFVDRTLGRLRAFSDTYSPWFAQMSGLDMAMICALLSGRDLYSRSVRPRPGGQSTARLGRDCDSLTHPVVLATMSALEDAYASFFNVNREWTAAGNAGFGLGRFPEDANDGVGTSGGNPWPLATLWGAQFYYHVAGEVVQVLEEAEGLPIALDDVRQVAFFQRPAGNGIDLAKPIEPRTWRERVLPAIVAHGDGYLNFVVQHTPDDGGVTEQVDRDTGAPRGARDLSWALSELITTIALREQVSSRM